LTWLGTYFYALKTLFKLNPVSKRLNPLELLLFTIAAKIAQKCLVGLKLFFFGHVHTRGGRGIETNNFCFIKRDPSRLNYFLEIAGLN
jgi:hypothetical protein